MRAVIRVDRLHRARDVQVRWRTASGRTNRTKEVPVNKTQLIEAVAARAELSMKDAGAVIDGLIETIQREVKKGERVTIPGFGTWERRQLAARKGRNPRTGEEIRVKARKAPAFRPGQTFKDIVSGEKKLGPAPKAPAKAAAKPAAKKAATSAKPAAKRATAAKPAAKKVAAKPVAKKTAARPAAKPTTARRTSAKK